MQAYTCDILMINFVLSSYSFHKQIKPKSGDVLLRISQNSILVNSMHLGCLVY